LDLNERSFLQTNILGNDEFETVNLASGSATQRVTLEELFPEIAFDGYP